MAVLWKCKVCKLVSASEYTSDKPDECGYCGANGKYLVPIGRVDR